MISFCTALNVCMRTSVKDFSNKGVAWHIDYVFYKYLWQWRISGIHHHLGLQLTSNTPMLQVNDRKGRCGLHEDKGGGTHISLLCCCQIHVIYSSIMQRVTSNFCYNNSLRENATYWCFMQCQEAWFNYIACQDVIPTTLLKIF